MSVKDYSLIADIGGTNARFALLEGPSKTPIEARNFVCADYPTVVDAIGAYLELVPFAKPVDAAMAVATVVSSDQLKMTNHSWGFSVSETRQALGFRQLKVLNDFTALALELPHLTPDKLHQFGPDAPDDQHVKAVIGPGTGLGVSGIAPIINSWFPLQGEGGHVSYGAMNDREEKVIRVIRKEKSHISAENLVSGSGLSLLYRTISQLEGGDLINLEPSKITQMAIDGICPIATETVSMFFEILGSVAGNLALTLGARGGVYIGGGIVPKVLELFIHSGFRERFEQHGRFTKYLSEIPTYVIIAKYPALMGAAFSLEPEYKSIGITSYS